MGVGSSPSSLIRDRDLATSGSGMGIADRRAFVYGWIGCSYTSVCRPLLHQMAQIHDADPMGNIVDHAQIMGHEQVGDPQLVLYLL